ncbi:aldo/keto reductase [Vagococcus jeotgali]|uniref:aldo/keto reductase n=1 Tax=Vagococcus jeotgali TaxID=3109030 RepID=UPI002DD83881|nr:aldo/keto reductase [Vagococcus sp. B2T-5]
MKKQDTTYTLANGKTIPKVGFGTWQTSEEEAEEVVKTAIQAGYRHIDTASIYHNEEGVGLGIKNSGVPREELFITTKLWNTDRSYMETKRALENSLSRLGLDYVDLYLIHWPNPAEHRDSWKELNAESWKAMEEAMEEGKIRSIGVSNFMPHHIKELEKTAKVMPVVNQIYLNPSDQQKDVVAYCKEKNILVEAYSPFGTGDIFKVGELEGIANYHKKTVAQIVLRWAIQKDLLPLPKSVTPSRIKENIEVFDFELTEKDMMLIDQLQGKAGHSRNPDEVDF